MVWFKRFSQPYTVRIRESEYIFVTFLSVVDSRPLPPAPPRPRGYSRLCEVESMKWFGGKLFGVCIPMAPADGSSICWRRTIEKPWIEMRRCWRTFAVQGRPLCGQWTFGNGFQVFAVDLVGMRYVCLSRSTWVNSTVFDFLFAEGSSAMCSDDVFQRKQRVQLCAFWVFSIRSINPTPFVSSLHRTT